MIQCNGDRSQERKSIGDGRPPRAHRSSRDTLDLHKAAHRLKSVIATTCCFMHPNVVSLASCDHSQLGIARSPERRPSPPLPRRLTPSCAAVGIARLAAGYTLP